MKGMIKKEMSSEAIKKTASTGAEVMSGGKSLTSVLE